MSINKLPSSDVHRHSQMNQGQNNIQPANPTSQKVAEVFLKIAVVFAALPILCLAPLLPLTTGAIGSQFIPGAQLALVPLITACAVCLIVSFVFGVSGYLIKALASRHPKPDSKPDPKPDPEIKPVQIPTVNIPLPSDVNPSNQTVLDYKKLPDLITRQDELARAQFVKKTYTELQKKHSGLELMTKNYGLQPSGVWLSFNMKGLSLIASELKAKHQLEHLHVCDSLEAFQNKLLEISQSEGDLKAALIIPTRGLASYITHVPESQHKTTVCIEKKDGKLKIMYIDSQPWDVDESLVKKPICELQDLDLAVGNASFGAFWAIYHSGIDMNHVELSRFMPTREHAGFGCETFALKDSVAFLKTDNFFGKMIKGPTPKGSAISQVIALPPDFMKTTQSLSQIQKYAEEYPALANQNLIRRKSDSPRSLQQAVKLRTKKGYNKNSQKVDQNHYTTMFSLKYHKMLLDSMANLETQAIKDKIDSTFVFVDRPLLKKGETPKTINDLFNKWNGKFSDFEAL